MKSADNAPLMELLQTKAGDAKRLPCAEAFSIAHDLDLSVGEVGTACDELEIKIVSCQLGCF